MENTIEVMIEISGGKTLFNLPRIKNQYYKKISLNKYIKLDNKIILILPKSQN